VLSSAIGLAAIDPLCRQRATHRIADWRLPGSGPLSGRQMALPAPLGGGMPRPPPIGRSGLPLSRHCHLIAPTIDPEAASGLGLGGQAFEKHAVLLHRQAPGAAVLAVEGAL
jgi:hypothetical protein